MLAAGAMRLLAPADDVACAPICIGGKSETFQAHGIPVSSAVLTSDLERLDRALWETGAEHLVILGDLIHTQLGLTAQVIQAVSDWRQRHPSPPDPADSGQP